MKKIVLSIVVTFFAINLSAQLNPIQNLQWEHWYNWHNFFVLTWETPEISEDTLEGYNIYRGDELFRFQTNKNMYHTPDSQNVSNDFLNYENGNFYIHVTSVYNANHEESDYNDSVDAGGIIIGLNEYQRNNAYIYPNPSSGKININISGRAEVNIVNSGGAVIKSMFIQGCQSIHLKNVPRGVYYVNIKQNGNIKTTPVVITE